MVGKTTAPKVQVTQEQLRMARLVQGFTMSEKEHQAAIKQVMDLTKCSVETAEIALHDHGNNIEEAVNSVLEKGNQTDGWNKTKGRKVKKPEGKKEKACKENVVEKKEVRFNDRRDNRNGGGANRGRDNGAWQKQTGDRNRAKQDQNDHTSHKNGDNSNRSDQSQTVTQAATNVGIHHYNNATSLVNPEAGISWSAIVKSAPSKLEHLESVPNRPVDSPTDDEFAADFKGLTFTNKQYENEVLLDKEHLPTLFAATSNGSQQSEKEAVPPLIENSNSSASLQEDHENMVKLTNMIKKDIGLPISMSTVTVSTAENDGLKSAQNISNISGLEHNNSPVVFLDQHTQNDWRSKENMDTIKELSFGDIKKTVEFVDEDDYEQLQKHGNAAISFDSYMHQSNSLTSSGIASGRPTPTPEPLGFTSFGTVINIPPTRFPGMDETRQKVVHPKVSMFSLVKGPSVDFYEHLPALVPPPGILNCGPQQIQVPNQQQFQAQLANQQRIHAQIANMQRFPASQMTNPQNPNMAAQLMQHYMSNAAHMSNYYL